MADETPQIEKFMVEEGGRENVTGVEQTVARGEVQPPRCNDAPFALLFYAQVAAMVTVAMVLGLPALNDGSIEKVESGNKSADYSGMIYLSLIAAGFAWILSAISLFVMSLCAKQLIQISLLFSVCMSLLVAISSSIMGSVGGAIVGFFFFAITCCYACIVWRRIPFAAANLNTGLTAVKKNCGVIFVAYLLVAVAFGYTVLWTLSLIGVYDKTADCNDGVCNGTPNGGYTFLLLLAYFWTQQVVQNTIHVTVAGVVGTWWFDPDDASWCCSKSIWGSFARSVTQSFGSICFGSLLVAIIQALRQLVETARQNDDGNALLLCIAECLLSCLQGIMEYFNKWAYIYVGLYGYNYISAGKKVMTLFHQRGWTVIITDDLVSNVLSLTCLVIGGLTGLIGLVVEAEQKEWFSEFDDDSNVVAFFIAFVIGLVISSILISVVDSSVNTVIVCFAEAPAEFQAHHPTHSEQMRDAWTKVYPDHCGF